MSANLLIGIALGIVLPGTLMLAPVLIGHGLNRIAQRKGRGQ